MQINIKCTSFRVKYYAQTFDLYSSVIKKFLENSYISLYYFLFSKK